jgi:hypothetical protein
MQFLVAGATRLTPPCICLSIRLSVRLSQMFPKVAMKPLLRPGWRQVVVHTKLFSLAQTRLLSFTTSPTPDQELY